MSFDGKMETIGLLPMPWKIVIVSDSGGSWRLSVPFRQDLPPMVDRSKSRAVFLFSLCLYLFTANQMLSYMAQHIISI